MLPARRRPPARTSSFLSFYVLEAVDPLPAAAARWKSSKLVFISTAALLLHLRRSRFLPAVPLAGCRQPTQTLLIVVVTGKATLYCVAWRSIQQSLSLYRGQMRHFQFRDQLLPLFSCLRNRSHRSKDQLRQRRVGGGGGGYSEHVFRSCCYTNTWRKNCYDDRSRPGRGFPSSL